MTGPDPLDVLYTHPTVLDETGIARRGFTLLVKPYFQPLPGYNDVLMASDLGEVVITGKMACLVSDRFLRAVKGRGARARLYPYSYCIKRVREKTARSGAGRVEAAPRPGDNWLPSSLKFRAWASLRYMIYSKPDEARRIAYSMIRPWPPEVDRASLAVKAASDIVERYYPESLVFAEEIVEGWSPRLGPLAGLQSII